MKIFAGMKLHPNGFLGAPLEYRQAHVKKPITVDLIGTATRKITLENEDNVLLPNGLIEEMFNDAIQHEDIMKRNFEFRERLYRAAMTAFGTTSIQEWVDKQKQSPYFDTMQNRFVEETVGYVFTGNRIKHPMIYVDTMRIGTHNAFSIGPNVREHLLNNYNKSIPIREFIQMWLGQTDGLSDLMFRLRVMFGS